MKKTAKATIKATVRRPQRPSLKNTQRLSQTLELPMEALVDTTYQESRAYLEVILPGRRSANIPLNDGAVTIGRDPASRLSIPSSTVSRSHARIVSRGEDHVIEDLDSTNGSFVNGVRISRCVLRNNDQIRIGDAVIQYMQQKVRRTS